MIIYADDREYSSKLFPHVQWQVYSFNQVGGEDHFLLSHLLNKPTSVWRAETSHNLFDKCVLVKKAQRSHFDDLSELVRRRSIGDSNVVCFAGAGEDFHGFKGRSWVAVEGNIHLTAYLKAKLLAPCTPSIVMALGAVSVVQSIEKVNPQLKPQIKWINDVLVEGAKVAGILTSIQVQEQSIDSALLGIGINVESLPLVMRSALDPEVTYLNRYSQTPCSQVVTELLSCLARNWNLLQQNQPQIIFHAYQEKMDLLGKEIELWSEVEEGEVPNVLVRGKVERIGENLELYMSQCSKPFYDGRIKIIKNENPA